MNTKTKLAMTSAMAILPTDAPRFTTLLFATSALIVTVSILPARGFAAYQAAPQQNAAPPQNDEIFKQAVLAFNQNRFSEARAKFEQVTPAHAQEARIYSDKIKAYIDHMQVAETLMHRSPDELDADSLDYAIQEYESAIKIKADGPGQPQEKLERARQIKAEVLMRSKDKRQITDRNLCDKALSASHAGRYKDAADLACALSNDNPGFLCGGDEALQLCQAMRVFANAHQSGASGRETNLSQRAKAAYDNNDFKQARSLFRHVSGPDKATADEYLDKIARYETLMAQAAEASRNLNYDDASKAYLEASKIKPDGPGNPQEQAATIELLLGIREFYSGKYVEAGQHLDSYARQSTQRLELVHFYMGASKLARFFLAGGSDDNLREDALNDFRVAMKGGFDAKDQDVSPKILRVYQELAF